MSLTLEVLEKRVGPMSDHPTLPGILKRSTIMTEGMETGAAEMGYDSGAPTLDSEES